MYKNNIVGGNDIFSLAFKVKESANPNEMGYSFAAYQSLDITWECSPSIVTVTSGSGSGGGSNTTVYTITPTGDADATVNTPFNVDVKLTADTETALYASAEAELTYNPSLVTPDLTGLDGVVSDSEPHGTLKITKFTSDGKAAEIGGGVTLATIPFEPIAPGVAVFSVSQGAFVCLAGTGGDEIGAASGKDLSVSIIESQPTVTFNAEYAALPSGYKLLMYELPDAPDKVWTYNGEDMHYIKQGGKHYITYIVSGSVDAESAETPVRTDNTLIPNNADVNGVGGVRVSDAQIIYDIINEHENYDVFEGLSVGARLGADVNNDGAVDNADVLAVVSAIHGK
jgi:hypothetical protein